MDFAFPFRNFGLRIIPGPHIVGYVAAGGFQNNFGPPSASVQDECFLPLLCVGSKREREREFTEGEKQIARKRERKERRERIE